MGIPDQVLARDVVMMADLGAAHPAEKFLGAVRVDPALCAVERPLSVRDKSNPL